MSEQLEAFVSAFEALCQDDSHGYSQVNRQGPDYDCSSAILAALSSAGFNTGGATYTGNMIEGLTANGWEWLTPDTAPERGDILLNIVHHVAVYLGDGTLGEFAHSEDGGADGQPGDQTGEEAIIHGFYKYPWDGFLRFSGADEKAQQERKNKMQCLIQPNGEARIVYFDGQSLHNLYHPDQAEAIAMVYREINGCEIPSFVMGSGDAPWYTRLQEAVNA